MFRKLLAVSLFACSLQALAADKALLIGVGEHQNSNYNLPGIDLDITNIKQAAKLLGFNNIKVLFNSDATEKGIKRQLEWLAQDIGEDDRVLLYFSGHGSQMRDQSGDEPDGLDEFLVASDFNVKNNQLSGYILDDYLNAALKRIKSRNVYVIVDACQSGTSTKFLSTDGSIGTHEAMSKYLKYVNMPEGAGTNSRGIAIQESDSGDNFVAISAAADTEYALAGSTGSYFTLGIMASLRQMMARGETSITPKRLHSEVVSFVHAKTEARNRFTPVLSGSQTLANKSLSLVSTGRQGVYWQELEKLANNFGDSISVKSNQSAYNMGEEIIISVEIPKSGYLNIITTDANDTPQILFPNKFMKDNRVDRGTFSTRTLPFEFKAVDPRGPNLTVAIITEQPLNLYEKSTLGRNEKGELEIPIAELDAVGLKDIKVRAIEVSARQDSSGSSGKRNWAGKVITTVR